MKFSPHPYQQLLIEHGIDIPRSASWAGMGMGKTVSSLTVLDARALAGQMHKTLVLAPKRVARSTWPNEIAKWDHLQSLEVSVITGTAEQRRAALRKDANIYTMNYDNLVWLIEHLGRDPWPFDNVVADESTRLKSFRLRQGGKRAQALGKVAHTKVKFWDNLTGTPAPNGLIDLWGQTWFLDAGERLGRTFGGFKHRWFQKAHNGYGVSPLPFAQEQIEDRVRDLCMALDPADWFDLEEPIVNRVYVDLPSKARQAYDTMEREMYAEINTHEIEAFNAASRTIKCLQLANGAIYTDDKRVNFTETHDLKLQALDSIIQEAAGMPVLIAYHFKHDLKRLLKAFPKGRELDYDPQTEDDWNAGKIPVLFAHPASAGHGLNLQYGGNIIVFFGHWWNLEHFQQIFERIGPVRQLQAGYKRPVWVYYILARNTVDDLVMARRESKRDVQDLLLEAAKRRS